MSYFELRIIMCWSFLKGPVPGEHDRLHGIEVLVQEVPVLLAGQVPYRLLDAQLYAAHQLCGLELLERHLPILHPPVTELLPLKDIFPAVIGGPIAVGPGDWCFRLKQTTSPVTLPIRLLHQVDSNDRGVLHQLLHPALHVADHGWVGQNTDLEQENL